MKPRKPLSLPGIDGPAVLREALRLVGVAWTRRPPRLLARGLTLGGLAMLSGCSLSDNAKRGKSWASSRAGTTAMQAWLFDPDKLAPTYPESMITRPFPFNAYYGIDESGTWTRNRSAWRSAAWSRTNASGGWTSCGGWRRSTR